MEKVTSNDATDVASVAGVGSDVNALLVELQEVSARSWEACHHSLPAAREQCDGEVMRLWIDLGIEIALGSGATGIRYFKESLAAVVSLEKREHRKRMLTAAIQLVGADEDVEGWGAYLALECVRSAPEAVSVVAEANLDDWVAIGTDLGRWNALAAAEYFRESPMALRVLPFGWLKRWVECGVKLVTQNTIDDFDCLLTLEFFRTTPRILSEIPALKTRMRVLECGSLVADRSPHVAMEFMKHAPKAVAAICRVPDGLPDDDAAHLREESNMRFEQWVQIGMQALEYSVEAARAYFTYESRWALLAIEQAMSEVSLRTMYRPLRVLVSGLSGKDIHIQPYCAHVAATNPAVVPECPIEQTTIERPPCLHDTIDTIALPTVLNVFPRKCYNACLYRVMAAHKAGHHEFGTYAFHVESIRDVIADLHMRYGRNHWPTSIWEVLGLYPSPVLAQDVWMIVEDARIDARLAREYPGLGRDMERIVNEAVRQRPSVQAGSLRDVVMEALMRMSVGHSMDGIPASCREIIGQAHLMFVAVREKDATCETSLRMADHLYRLLDVLSPTDWLVSEGQGVEADICDPRSDQENQIMPQSHEFAHRKSITNLFYRGTVQQTAPEGIDGLPQNMWDVDIVEAKEASDRASVFQYDEWDATIGDYRSRWCSIIEETMAITHDSAAFVARTLANYQWTIRRLRKSFQGIRPSSLRWVKNQLDGEDIDMDAAVDRFAERCAWRASLNDRIFMNRAVRVRSVSAAVLMDMSGSTSRALDVEGKRVIDVEKEAMLLLCEALDALGDRYAIYGFSGRSRHDVHFTILKAFDDAYDDRSRQRIGAVEPMHQNRDGAAIRHAVAKLRSEHTKVKLLLFVSDGKPLDDRYDHEYAFEDTRMALLEAKRLGICPFCVTIDREAPAYLNRMCGEVGFVIVDQVKRLPDCLPNVYRRLAM